MIRSKDLGAKEIIQLKKDTPIPSFQDWASALLVSSQTVHSGYTAAKFKLIIRL